jgi:hypothetical protein
MRCGRLRRQKRNESCRARPWPQLLLSAQKKGANMFLFLFIFYLFLFLLPANADV